MTPVLVAVFRARDDGERTAARLGERGHAALLAPVFDIVPTGARPPDGPFGGVIFTSAHGVLALSQQDVDRLAAVPAFCVGDRTAECARAAGFLRIRNARADADRLASVVTADVGDRGARLLLVAGRDRKPFIEQKLAAAGHAAVVVEAYEARALPCWPDDINAALAVGNVSAALHYSRRSAALALACAAAGAVSTHLRGWTHHCLSDDAAGPLREAGIAKIRVSAAPNETSLLDTLGQPGWGAGRAG